MHAARDAALDPAHTAALEATRSVLTRPQLLKKALAVAVSGYGILAEH